MAPRRAACWKLSVCRSPRDSALDRPRAGDRASVVNCDGVHTIAQTMLTRRVGELDEDALTRVCSALSYALGC